MMNRQNLALQNQEILLKASNEEAIDGILLKMVFAVKNKASK